MKSNQKLTDATIQYMRSLHADGKPQQMIVILTGISRATVWRYTIGPRKSDVIEETTGPEWPKQRWEK
jgi:hypothetical protein